jgi:hypothetical protein
MPSDDRTNRGKQKGGKHVSLHNVKLWCVRALLIEDMVSVSFSLFLGNIYVCRLLFFSISFFI